MVVPALLAVLLLTSSSLNQGEQLFLADKPQQALPLLEKALLENPQEEKAYLYLGITYEQLNDTQKAIQVFKRGLNVARQLKHLFYFDLGNEYFRLEEYTLAEQMYSNAIEAQAGLADAYLNRANARLELQSYQAARQDYIDYLKLEPESWQRASIEKLIALLGQLLEDQERERLAELERQKALMNEVLDTLKNASEDTRNLSAGSEKIQEEYEEVDIED
jgi:tetratricopeptide (TPR) repeat protein